MMPPIERWRGLPLRTSLYSEALVLSVLLRWLLVASAGLWLALERAGLEAAWVLAGVVVYNAVLTGLVRRGGHPPLFVVAGVDLVALVAFLVLEDARGGHALLALGFPVIVLTLAYGRRGVALSLGTYVIGEAAVYFIVAPETLPLGPLLARAASLATLALVLGALVERYDGVRARLARISIHDRVTGLYNRHYFAESLEHLHKLAVRGEWPYSVIVFRLEGLDRVVQTRGWAAGDRLLRLLGVQARSAVRSTDVVSRVGEAEFAIALPETDLAGAERAARKVGDRLRGVTDQLEFAIGVADIRPSRANAFEDCLHAAYGAAERAIGLDDDRVATTSVPSRSTVR